MHKTFKDLFDLWYAPCSILLVQPKTKKSEYIEFKFGQLASDIELKNLFSRFDDNGYVVGGANLNGHRMPKDEVYARTVADVADLMKKKGDTDEYFPTFYVVICKDIDEDGNVANIVLERLKEDYPYVYLKKPWKLSYPILGHIHERSIYRLEENGDEIVAVFDSGAGGVADRIVFDKDHAKSIRRIIATNKCL